MPRYISVGPAALVNCNCPFCNFPIFVTHPLRSPLSLSTLLISKSPKSLLHKFVNQQLNFITLFGVFQVTDEDEAKLGLQLTSKFDEEMSVAELKERHMAATETLNSLRERLKEKRLQLLDTDGISYC